MPDDDDVITITPCPVDAGSHTFRLHVARIRIAALLDEDDEWVPVTRTHVFTCPANQRAFEADITVYRRRNEIISGVEALPG